MVNCDWTEPFTTTVYYLRCFCSEDSITTAEQQVTKIKTRTTKKKKSKLVSSVIFDFGQNLCSFLRECGKYQTLRWQKTKKAVDGS